MFFIVSKILWTFVQPISVTLLLLVVAGLALWRGRRALAGWAMALSGAILFICSFTTLGVLMIAPLEARFALPAALPAKVSTIIVLGGGIDGEVSKARQRTELSAGGDRFVEGLRLAQLYPDAKILISGGFGSLIAEGDTDAAVAQRFYVDMGIAPDRLLLEGQSRNTAENAAMTRDMVGTDHDGAVLLVTSAFHMPRSMGLFRAAGFDVVPWPVDYRATGAEGLAFEPSNPPENLLTVTVAFREWIGLLAYWATGKIASPFPSPSE